MDCKRASLNLCRIVAGMMVIGAYAGTAAAQAWVAEQGTLGGSLSFQTDSADKLAEGSIELPGIDTSVQTLALGLEYTPWKRLGLSALIPLAMVTYSGTDTPHGVWDDGKSHLTLTDFSFTARYAVIETPLVVTPHVGVSVPMTDYETAGFAAPGRHLLQANVGLSVARDLGPILPRAYVHGLYQFTVSQKADDHPDLEKYSQNSSRFGIQVGYAILDSLGVDIALDGLIHHGGVNFVNFADMSSAERDFHDIILKESGYYLGAGINYSIGESLVLGAAFRQFIEGDNTRMTRLFGVSVGWSANFFGDDQAYEDQDQSDEAEQLSQVGQEVSK